MDIMEIIGSNPFDPEHLPEVNGFDEYSELSNQDVENLINTLIPEGHLDNCGNIICNPNDPHWLETPGAVGYHVEYTDGSPCEICLAGSAVLEGSNSSELEVLCHEIGHNAYNNLSLEDQIKWSGIHAESMVTYDETGLGFVSNYAHTNLFEDFAETYAIYMTNPDLLQFVSPEKYEFMCDKVFDGTEYGQIPTGNGDWALVTKNFEDLYNQVESQVPSINVANIVSSGQMSSSDAIFRCFSMVT